MAEKRGFKGIWIPREIWLHTGLTMQEKIMLVEIDSLDNDDGCWAQNKYFADFLGLSERRVQTIIKSLKDKGFVCISYTYKPGTREIERRTLKINPAIYPRPSIFGGEIVDIAPAKETTPGGEGNDTTPHEGTVVGVVKKTTQGGEGNGVDNNTLSNKPYLIKPEDKKKAATAAPIPDLEEKGFSPELKAKVEEWIQYKKEQRKPYKPMGLKNLLSEIKHNADRYGDHAVAELISTCMAANYQGIIFDKLREQRGRNPATATVGSRNSDWDPMDFYA